MQDYGAFVAWTCPHLYALLRSGFTREEIQKMSPQDRLDLGEIVLTEEHERNKKPH